jgi:hypothetical protein
MRGVNRYRGSVRPNTALKRPKVRPGKVVAAGVSGEILAMVPPIFGGRLGGVTWKLGALTGSPPVIGQ